MNRYLFDTNHVGVFFRAGESLREKVLAHPDDEFGLSTPTIAELWFMVHNSRRQQENRATFQSLLAAYVHWPFDEATAEVFGRTKTLVKRAGKTVADVDLQIASIALVNDLVVLTADAAFGNVPGLRVENWLAP